MRMFDIPQGSLPWITNRLWRLTASTMSKCILASGELSRSQACFAHIDKLIAGLDLARALEQRQADIDEMDDWQLKNFMRHYIGDTFAGNIHTERGHEFEPDAIAVIQELIGEQIFDTGMCVMGDNPFGVVSCSPDGYTKDAQGNFKDGVEVKAPVLCKLYGYFREDVLPSEYKLQVHSSMAICEADRWHFGAYFKDKPLFYKLVKRDKLTDKLEKSFYAFAALYREQLEKHNERMEKLTRKDEDLIL